MLAPDRGTRDKVLAALGELGLGASAFYGTALPYVRDCPRLETGSVPHAAEFADRLLTLPVHSGVGERDCDRMLATLASADALG